MRVEIEWSNECQVCRKSLNKLINILKKYDIPFVLRNINDKSVATFDKHKYNPTVSSMLKNKHNIKNKELKEIIDAMDFNMFTILDMFLRQIPITPKIYIYHGDNVLIINGVYISEKKNFFEKFEKLIQELVE